MWSVARSKYNRATPLLKVNWSTSTALWFELNTKVIESPTLQFIVSGINDKPEVVILWLVCAFPNNGMQSKSVNNFYIIDNFLLYN